MELNIVHEKDNPLMLRKEITAEASQFDVTPSRKALLAELEKKFHFKNVVIHKVEHPFGSKVAKVMAQVYQTPQAMKEYAAPYLASRTEGKKDGQGNASEKKA